MSARGASMVITTTELQTSPFVGESCMVAFINIMLLYGQVMAGPVEIS
jgi:hypothetical protein